MQHLSSSLISRLNRRSIVLVVLLLVFVFTRLWNIGSSLEFFADIGRDHLVLLQTTQTRKIPLLGPSNSAFPFNQSPIYYYLNLPIFIASHASPYATLLTLTILYVVVFVLGLFVFRKDVSMIQVFTVLIVLITFHPQFVDQHRYPWNPTFTVPFMLVALFSLFSPSISVRKRTIIFSLSIMVAIGCSYGIVPSIFVLCFYALVSRKISWRLFIPAVMISAFAMYWPFLIVEVRHNFIMTRRALLALQMHEIHGSMSFFEKIRNLSAYLTGVEVGNWVPIAIVGLSVVASLIWNKKYGMKAKWHTLFFILFCSSYILTILAPFTLEPHYIFGIQLFFFCTIATMRKTFLLPLLGIFLIFWVPHLQEKMTYLPLRTIAQMESCAMYVCQNEKTPMYLSEQAWHLSHFAPDHLFFFGKSGCVVSDITQSPLGLSRMAVVADNSSYQHNVTRFNELSLFGKSHVEHAYSCDGNMNVYILRRDTQ